MDGPATTAAAACTGLAAWRSRHAQAVETRELRAALGWFAGPRFDPQL